MNTATDIAAQVRSGRLTAAQVIESALNTAEQAHADLNAFTLIDRSGAMHRAEAIDRLVEQGRDPGPLAGVPIALKDLIDDAGMPTTNGSSFPTEVATTSASVVRRLGAAGAVIVGRVGLHEFAFGFTSENPWFGPVRNPWDPDTSPGGSSGGSAAVVAAGVVPVAIGTDTGGSVRVPAALCGIMGLKVTHGRVPLTGVTPLVGSLDTVGPLARTVDDLAASYIAMAGDDASDPWSQNRAVDGDQVHSPEGIRLGVPAPWNDGPMSDTVRADVATFLERCSSLGIEIVELSAEVLTPPESLVDAIAPEILEVHRNRFEGHPERYGADVAGRIEAAMQADPSAVIEAERWGSAARAEVSRLEDKGITALVAPTVGASIKVIGEDDISIRGEQHFHRSLLSRYTAPINRIRLPALSVPVAHESRRGESIQLIGSMWSESSLLGIARLLESEDVIGVGTPPIHFDETV
ncbi:MAG: amidase [Acidimicrobiia bacterium]